MLREIHVHEGSPFIFTEAETDRWRKVTVRLAKRNRMAGTCHLALPVVFAKIIQIIQIQIHIMQKTIWRWDEQACIVGLAMRDWMVATWHCQWCLPSSMSCQLNSCPASSAIIDTFCLEFVSTFLAPDSGQQMCFALEEANNCPIPWLWNLWGGGRRRSSWRGNCIGGTTSKILPLATKQISFPISACKNMLFCDKYLHVFWRHQISSWHKLYFWSLAFSISKFKTGHNTIHIAATQLLLPVFLQKHP